MSAHKELLDSESWGGILESFARSVDVAAALIDHDGALIGEVHNPKPIWKLARAVRPDWGNRCIFCLDEAGHCTAAADAEQRRSLVIKGGLGGYAHTATPLFLGDQHLGTLLAGQVFEQYPELLFMERVAREYGLSGQMLWQLARQAIPVSRATLTTYGYLLGTLSHAYLQQRHAVMLQRELTESNQYLQDANAHLAAKVLELDRSVVEKEALLQEVHHRVNNNLAVISGLLHMQADAFPDNQVADALRASQSRVESMALVHAQLYNSADFSAVKFAAYALDLAENLFVSYGIDRSRIQLKVEIDALELGVDKAIPAGLILNELIANTLKHAFPEGRRGVITVKGRLRDGQVEFSVHDDGVGIGFSKQPSDPRRKSLGMQIVKILCRQLNGVFQPPLNSGELGTTFIFSFPEESLYSAATRG